MVPSTESAEPRRPSWRKRVFKRIPIVIAGLAIALAAFYLWENWRGRKALHESVAKWTVDGYSLRPESLLPSVGPIADNFGGTPLLDEIATPVGPEIDAAWKKRVFLEKLMPGRVDFDRALSARKWNPRLAVLEDSVEWNCFRTLLAHAEMSLPAEEPAGAAAVYRALDSKAAVFQELSTAAKRPQAYFTPLWNEPYMRNPGGAVSSLEAILLLRARAAAATGHPEETVKLSGVIWRLREAVISEDADCRHWPDEYWITAARDVCRAKERTDAMMHEVASQPGSYWSAEAELLRLWNLRAAVATSEWMKALSDSERGFMFSSFCLEWKDFDHFLAKWGPSGWHDQNMALNLKRFYESFVQPLKTGGFAALREALVPLEKESEGEKNTLFRMFHLELGTPAKAKLEMNRATRIRLMLLAIGMERFRLKNGTYPAAVTELVPDFMDEVPPGIDGKPLSISTSPDKMNSLLYSAPWDRDPASVRREPPASGCGGAPAGGDEWSLTLPFPHLQP